MTDHLLLKSRYFTRLRKFFRRLGFYKAILFLLLISIVSSVVITNLVSLITSGEFSSWEGNLIAIIVPTIVAPLLSMINLPLLYMLDEAEILLQQIASRDDMTGAANRRRFLSLLEAELQRNRRYGGAFSIAFLDVDDFKVINDTYGHLAGDEVLRIVTQVGTRLIRVTDTFARYGGDEFVILMPNTGTQPAMDCMQRICRAIADAPIPAGSSNLSITISAGVITCQDEPATLETLLSRVDRALYTAKRLGKNRVSSEDLLLSGVSQSHLNPV
jgi:diguanylate cyclase (GGDEF)-like protein